MKQKIIDLARYRMAKAEDCFKDGELLLVQGSIHGAINRFYYAAFHAARALLATKEIDAASHSGVITLFSKHIVKEGFLFPKIAKTLSRALERRLDSDYDDYTELSLKEAEKMKNEVRDFIKNCSEVLERFLKRGN
ncbi:MAG: HEPN domain-containing protein [Candidatus Desantisbacteria bacterium]